MKNGEIVGKIKPERETGQEENLGKTYTKRKIGGIVGKMKLEQEAG